MSWLLELGRDRLPTSPKLSAVEVTAPGGFVGQAYRSGTSLGYLVCAHGPAGRRRYAFARPSRGWQKRMSSAAIRPSPISINLRLFGVGSLPRRGRRTQPGVLTPGKVSSRDRPERALDVRVGCRVYCEPRNSSSQDDIRRGVSDLAAETWDAFQ